MTYSDDPENRVPSRPIGLTRISYDRAGDALGVARQEADVRTLAKLLQWPNPIQVIVENDTSAFSRRRIRTPSGRTELRTVRPGFRRAIELLETGEADGLIAYDLDRAARDPRDLEDLIDVVEHHQPRIAVRSVTGSLRLDNDADVTMARVMVAIANKASRDASRRIKRKMDEIAAAGMPGGGGRAFGFEPGNVVIRESEAELIRDAVARVIGGETIDSICADFNDRGIPPIRAEAWRAATLHQLLRSARVAGLRMHRGEIIGPAAWPGIITVETREALLARLATRPARLNASGLRYWCGHLLWCGRCGSPMVGHTQNSPEKRIVTYWCSTELAHPGCGRVSISGPQTGAWVTHWTLDVLGRRDTQRTIALTSPGPSVVKVARRVYASANPRRTWDLLRAGEKRDVVSALLGASGSRGWQVSPALSPRPRFDPDRFAFLPAQPPLTPASP